MKNPIRALKQWLDTKIVKWDTSRVTNRDLRDPSTGETEILKIVIPCVRYNPDTGQMANWDHFDAAIDFDGNVIFNGTVLNNAPVTLDALLQTSNDIHILDVGDELMFGDGDTGIHEAADDDLRLEVGGVDVVEIVPPGILVTGDVETTDDVIVGDDIYLGLGQFIYLDDDNDSTISMPNDTQMDFIIDGSARFRVYSGHVDALTYLYSYDFERHRRRVAGDPSTQGDSGLIYSKDVATVAEMFAMDEGGVVTQLTSHDDEGYYYHHSTIPKRNLDLSIDIERFFRDHYPKYIREAELDG